MPRRNRRRRSFLKCRSGPRRRSSRPGRPVPRPVRLRSTPPWLFLRRRPASMSRRMGTGQTLAPDAATIERLAEAAIARLPDTFRRHLTNVVLRIDDYAEDEVLTQLGIEDPFELTGLYSGRSLDKQDSWASGELPPMIHLYRRPLLDE